MTTVIHHGLDAWQLYSPGSRETGDQTSPMKSSLFKRKKFVLFNQAFSNLTTHVCDIVLVEHVYQDSGHSAMYFKVIYMHT